MEDDEDDDKDLPLPPALMFGGSAIRGGGSVFNVDGGGSVINGDNEARAHQFIVKRTQVGFRGNQSLRLVLEFIEDDE